MKNQQNGFGLWMLAWPIFLELFLQTLLGTVDTLMVSRISDDAVAVVGISNQLFGALTTLFTTFAGGAGILIAQRIGSERTTEARSIAILGVSISAGLGIAVSILLFFFAGPIGSMLSISPELQPLSDIYIAYVGGGLFLVGMSVALGTAIRNTGNTRGPMYTGIAVNVIHIVLNYGFIFGALGLPQMGLAGIAISNLVSRLLGTAVLYILFSRSFEIRVKVKDFAAFSVRLFREILSIAWPLGVNSSSWVFSQLIIYSFLARLGSEALAARTYLNTLESYCFALGYAVAMAGQIRTAHLYGGGRTQEAYTGAFRTLFVGLGIVTANMAVLFLSGRQLLGFFTNDPVIVSLGVSLLALNLLLQPAKMLNMAMGNALNAIGDTRFTMYISVVSMFLISVGCSYLFGIMAGWGLSGIYWCMIADETLRGVLVLRRWRGRKRLRSKESEAGFQSCRPEAQASI